MTPTHFYDDRWVGCQVVHICDCIPARIPAYTDRVTRDAETRMGILHYMWRRETD